MARSAVAAAAVPEYGIDRRSSGWADGDLRDGFELTGWFLLRNVLEPRGQGHSDARAGFIAAVAKYMAKLSALPP